MDDNVRLFSRCVARMIREFGAVQSVSSLIYWDWIRRPAKPIQCFPSFLSVEAIHCDICHGCMVPISWNCLWLYVPCVMKVYRRDLINSYESSLCQSYGITVFKVELNNQSSLLDYQSSHFRWVNICYS